MSGSVRSRLRRLERAINAPGIYSECGGLNRVRVVMDDEALPEPCSGCGRQWTVVRLIRGEYPEAKIPDDPRRSP